MKSKQTAVNGEFSLNCSVFMATAATSLHDIARIPYVQ